MNDFELKVAVRVLIRDLARSVTSLSADEVSTLLVQMHANDLNENEGRQLRERTKLIAKEVLNANGMVAGAQNCHVARHRNRSFGLKTATSNSSQPSRRTTSCG